MIRHELRSTIILLIAVALSGLSITAQEVESPDSLEVQQLEDFVVTFKSVPKPIKLSPVVTQVISAREMTKLGIADLSKILSRQTPGLNIRKAVFGNEISLQGLDARHILMLIDGERLTGDMAGNLDFERFNVHSIERIEIVKGASSTLFGSRGSGAVLNFITKKAVHPIEVEAGVRWGQMNEINFSGAKRGDFNYLFEKQADRPNLQAWLSAGLVYKSLTSQTDLQYGSQDAFNVYQTSPDEKRYTAQANSFLPRDTTIISSLTRPAMGIEGNEFVTVSQKLYWEPEKLPIKALLYGNLFLKNQYDLLEDLVFNQSEDYTAGFRFKWSLRDYFTMSAGIHLDYFNRYKRHELMDEVMKEYRSSIIRPQVTFTSSYFEGHDLTLGVEYFSDRLTSNRFSGRSIDLLLTRALSELEYYLQDDWRVSDKWLLSLGLRSSYTPQFGLYWMPKVAAKYALNDEWNFRLNYARGFRAPSIKELFFNWDHMGLFRIRGNENIRPEQNDYVALGVEYGNSTFSASGTVYANFFRNKIEGVWKVYDLQYNFDYDNLASQRLLGAELLLRWQPLERWNLSASYAYANISPLNGLQINTSAPHTANAALQYTPLIKNGHRLTLSLDASYTGEKNYDVQDRIAPPGETTFRNAWYRVSLPDYTIANFSILHSWKDRVRLVAGVENLLNFIPSTIGSGLTLFSVPATPGRRYFIQLELSLEKEK